MFQLGRKYSEAMNAAVLDEESRSTTLYMGCYRETADRLYDELTRAGIEVLLDDRDARPGAKFADAELLGIPHRVVVGERGLEAGNLEYRHRRAEASEDFALEGAVAFIRSRLAPG